MDIADQKVTHLKIQISNYDSLLHTSKEEIL